MKKVFNFIRFIIYINLCFFILTSCFNENSKRLNPWRLNDSNGWFFSSTVKKNLNSGMIYIEGGSFIMGNQQDGIIEGVNHTPIKRHVSPFYMGQTEVTNGDYRSYLMWLNYVFPQESLDFQEIYKEALPKANFDAESLKRNDPFIHDYFDHIAFDNYPVLVSWEQADRFCHWLSERVNEKKLIQQGLLPKDFYKKEYLRKENIFDLSSYKKDPKSIHVISKGSLTKKIETYGSVSTSRFRLPTESEWEYAALALSKARILKPYNRNEKKINRVKIKSRDMDGLRDYSKGWDFNEPTKPNSLRQHPSKYLGLYGMYGNVAEWVADVYDPFIDNKEHNLNYYKGKTKRRALLKEKGKKNKSDEEKLRLRDKSFLFDTFRVIKGTSYKDEPYQSNPFLRRYMSQKESISWVGFRVVQDFLGDKEKQNEMK